MMTTPQILSQVSLELVIEISPWNLNDDAHGPDRSAGDDAWDLFWRTTLQSHEIEHVRQIAPRSCFVSTRQFVDLEPLKTVVSSLHGYWKEPEQSLEDPDNFIALNGGLALFGPTQNVVLEPQCCGDLGDLNEWEIGLQHRGPDWLGIWIGHPLLQVRYRNSMMEMALAQEAIDLEPAWAVRVDQMERSLVQARKEQLRFALLLQAVLEDLPGDASAGTIARRWAGLES